LSYIMTFNFICSLEGLRREVRVKFPRSSVKMKLFFVLSVIGAIVAEPQLDLPQSTVAPRRSKSDGPQVLVLPNAYTSKELQSAEEKSGTNTNFDSDRSQRFG
jgi:hypothetical protein